MYQKLMSKNTMMIFLLLCSLHVIPLKATLQEVDVGWTPAWCGYSTVESLLIASAFVVVPLQSCLSLLTLPIFLFDLKEKREEKNIVTTRHVVSSLPYTFSCELSEAPLRWVDPIGRKMELKVKRPFAFPRGHNMWHLESGPLQLRRKEWTFPHAMSFQISFQ